MRDGNYKFKKQWENVKSSIADLLEVKKLTGVSINRYTSGGKLYIRIKKTDAAVGKEVQVDAQVRTSKWTPSFESNVMDKEVIVRQYQKDENARSYATQVLYKLDCGKDHNECYYVIDNVTKVVSFAIPQVTA